MFRQSRRVVVEVWLDVIPIVGEPPEFVSVVHQELIGHIFRLRATLKAASRESKVVSETRDNFSNCFLRFYQPLGIRQQEPVLANKHVVNVHLDVPAKNKVIYSKLGMF